MAAIDYKTPTTEIPFPNGGSMTVRGLNLDDLSALLQDHLEPISKAVDAYRLHKESAFTNANLMTFILTLAKDFPGLVSEVISIATDEPGARNIKFSLGIQVSALAAVSKLTLEEAGGLGNLFATLATLARGVLPNASE